MECTVYGKVEKPVVVLVGSWDPLLDEHFKLIDIANKHAIDSGYELLIVLIDPVPSNLLLNRVLPVFDCPTVRINFMLRKITGAVCMISMKRADVDFGVQEFFSELQSLNFEVAELWLHPGQSLGRCTEGSRTKIEQVCHDHNVRITDIQPNNALRELTGDVRNYLQNGSVEKAIKLMQHPPLWQKPQDKNYIAIGWQPGRYEFCSAAILPDSSIQLDGERSTLEFFLNEHEHTIFEWPRTDYELIAITGQLKDD
jgi:FAD synthase